MAIHTIHISIHALLAESDSNQCKIDEKRSSISIHALLAESDKITSKLCNLLINISIHALLAESDAFLPADRMSHQEFLSTLSLRRATNRIFHVRSFTSISIHALLAESDSLSRTRAESEIDFYPRSPCGERQYCSVAWLDYSEISIHALLAESDDDLEPSKTRKLTFLSTLSLRRATRPMLCPLHRQQHFYPRSPCGERPRTQSQSLSA